MNVWQFIHDKLSAAQGVMLLCVLKSEGSSPGRQGFKMAVAADGTFCGTIGGGIMEHKLVQKAKNLLQQNDKHVSLMWQHHDKEHAGNQSGMICSGSQLNVFIPIAVSDKSVVKEIITAEKKSIQLSPKGLEVVDEAATGLQYNSDSDWIYSEIINRQPVIHIIGGGHVGLALSELMKFLGFYIKLYDDRPELNTIAANSFAHEKRIVNYDSVSEHFENAENDYAVIMTIGYRTDKTVLKQLIDKQLFYLGLLGSDHKIKTLFKELKDEGINEGLLSRIFSPVGLNIASKTAREIAVSIAAEIISQKNKELP
ncbi:MAG: XdhC family protein [Ferruginibacter sp.]|nr:XdhC family protein [Ferruginibacter sp.]